MYSTSKRLIRFKKNGNLVVSDGFKFNPVCISSNHQLVEDILDFLAIPRLEGEIGNQFDPRILEFLRIHNVIQEADYIEPILEYKSKNQNEYTMYLVLTHACNLRCVYCLDHKSKTKAANMTFSTAKAAIDKMIEAINDDDKLQIHFFGGEPLLQWGLAKSIIEYVEEKKKKLKKKVYFDYSFSTNLTFLPEDFLGYRDTYNIKLAIDIDGPEEIHNILRPASNSNSYSMTVQNIKKINKQEAYFDLRCTLNSHNLARLRETLSIHKDLGANLTLIGLLRPVTNSRELIEQMSTSRFGRIRRMHF